jgi:hypothetical protein
MMDDIAVVCACAHVHVRVTDFSKQGHIPPYPRESYSNRTTAMNNLHNNFGHNSNTRTNEPKQEAPLLNCYLLFSPFFLGGGGGLCETDSTLYVGH